MARLRGGKGVRRRGGRSGDSALWWVVLGLLAVFVGAATAGILWFLASRPEFDEATLCPEDGPSGVMAVLLDLTDPVAPTQVRRLEAMIDRLVERVPVHTMVSIGIVSEHRETWGARFALCKPAAGDEANVLYENPQLIADTFSERFLKPLEATMEEMLRGEPENRSPIMESLQALLAETPKGPASRDNMAIVIASDLLQHSENLSLYRDEGWDHFVASGGVERLARNLDGAKVTLIRIPRPGAAAGAVSRIDPFWSRYLDQQGASAPFEIMTLGDL